MMPRRPLAEDKHSRKKNSAGGRPAAPHCPFLCRDHPLPVPLDFCLDLMRNGKALLKSGNPNCAIPISLSKAKAFRNVQKPINIKDWDSRPSFSETALRCGSHGVLLSFWLPQDIEL